MEKYYGFRFFGEGLAADLVQTYLPVGQAALPELLTAAENYAGRVTKFTPLFGVIKELAMFEGEVGGNFPAKVGMEKNQAFILKRSGDVITGEGNDFFLNDKQLSLGFESYDVNIIEIKE